jgi:hypothetical protein
MSLDEELIPNLSHVNKRRFKLETEESAQERQAKKWETDMALDKAVSNG